MGTYKNVESFFKEFILEINIHRNIIFSFCNPLAKALIPKFESIYAVANKKRDARQGSMSI